MVEIEFNKSDFNDIYLSYLDDTTRILVFYGGGGSGKSVFIAQRYLYLCLSRPYFRLVFCRKVANTIRYSQFQLFKDLIFRSGLDQFFTIRESTMEIGCANGNKLWAFGLDNTEKIKSIQEPTDIWVEEATEISREDFIQLNLRLRTRKASNQLVLSFNPITTEHWLYDSFFVKKEFPANIVKTTYLDNRFLPDAYKAELEALKNTDENYYKIYCLGDFGGKIKGLIYPRWQMVNHFPQFCDYIYGLDFGFHDPTCLTKVGIVDQKHAFIQEKLYRSGLTSGDIINILKNSDIGQAPIYADSARPEMIEDIFRAGFNIHPCQKGKDSVQAGIDFIKGLNLNILDDSPNLIKELNNYRWAEDKNKAPIEGEPIDFLNHACDSFRYALWTHLGRGSGGYISVL